MIKNSAHTGRLILERFVLLLDLVSSEFVKCAWFITYAVCRILHILFKNLTKLLSSVGLKNLFYHMCMFESILF